MRPGSGVGVAEGRPEPCDLGLEALDSRLQVGEAVGSCAGCAVDPSRRADPGDGPSGMYGSSSSSSIQRGLLLAGRAARAWRDERLGAVGQPAEGPLDGLGRRERVEALGAGPQLGHGLGAAQEQHAHDTARSASSSPKHLVGHLAVAGRALARARVDHPGQALGLQHEHGGLDVERFDGHHRVAVRGLVARGGQGLEREGVDVGRRQLLLDEGAEHAALGTGEHAVTVAHGASRATPPAPSAQ